MKKCIKSMRTHGFVVSVTGNCHPLRKHHLIVDLRFRHRFKSGRHHLLSRDLGQNA